MLDRPSSSDSCLADGRGNIGVRLGLYRGLGYMGFRV